MDKKETGGEGKMGEGGSTRIRLDLGYSIGGERLKTEKRVLRGTKIADQSRWKRSTNPKRRKKKVALIEIGRERTMIDRKNKWSKGKLRANSPEHEGKKIGPLNVRGTKEDDRRPVCKTLCGQEEMGTSPGGAQAKGAKTPNDGGIPASRGLKTFCKQKGEPCLEKA